MAIMASRAKKKIDKKISKKRWDVITETLDVNAKMTGAEIGVEQGKTSKVLLSRMSKLHLILVDRWCVTPPGDTYFKGSRVMSRYNAQDWKSVYNKAMANIAPYKNRVSVLKMESGYAAETITNGSLDFIFIDANHTYEATKGDILAWYPKVKYGGYIMGHDYANENTFGDVKKAVDEIFGSDIKLSHDHVWIHIKKEGDIK